MKTLTAPELRRISVAASVDPRTVRQYLVGNNKSTMVAARIEEALRQLGLVKLIRGSKGAS